MAFILCIETATNACSVSLIGQGEIIGSRMSLEKNAHSRILNLFIDELMAESGVPYSKLDAVAVSKGPGSYTGLRIGVSTAKGLCYALDIPLIALDTLQCMASGVLMDNPAMPADSHLCPMIDARRMEVFAAVYDPSLQTISPVDAIIVDETAFRDLPEAKPVYYFGDGAEKCRQVLAERKDWVYIPGFVNSAIHMAQPAMKHYREQRFEDTAYFEPFYLKDFIAGKPVVKGLKE